MEDIEEYKIDDFKFKGYIDLVLRSKTDKKYHIIDWKTTSWGWEPQKKNDAMTTYQLTYYKHFLAKKINTQPENIETHFGLLKRTAKKDKVELFRKGLDEYKVFASESLYQVPYDEVTKDMRQVAKSAVLGAMFGQGAKGLVKYAEGMGVVLSEAQSQNAVQNYRASYSRVKELWAQCEGAAMEAIKNEGMPFNAGNKIVMKCVKGALWMRLPSGRLICWQRPQLELLTTPWGSQKMGVTVHSQNTFTRQWSRNALIGSSIFQSAVQGTARDFLAVAMLNLDKAGYEIINSVHDEVLLLVEEQNGESAMADVIKIMTTPPSWAPDFPLAAEGWFGKRYRK